MDDSRMEESRSCLIRTGHVEMPDGRWRGEHYTATITDQPSLALPGTTPSYVISFRMNEGD
jgi:hypothetical protein